VNGLILLREDVNVNEWVANKIEMEIAKKEKIVATIRIIQAK